MTDKVFWSEFESVTTAPRTRGSTWEEICALVGPGAKRWPRKQDMPLMKLGVFGTKATTKGSLRSDENVARVFGIEGDHDAGTMQFRDAVDLLEKYKIAATIYTTPSHTSDKPRWRVLAPTSEAVKPEARYSLVARLNGVLGGTLAAESFTLSQPFYFGRVDGVEFLHHCVLDGQFIDQLDGLDEIAIGRTKWARETSDGVVELSTRVDDSTFALLVKERDRKLRTGDGRRDLLKALAGRLSRSGENVATIMAAIDKAAADYFDPSDPMDRQDIYSMVSAFVASDAPKVRKERELQKAGARLSQQIMASAEAKAALPKGVPAVTAANATLGAKPSTSALDRLMSFVVTEEQVKKMKSTKMIWRNLIAHGHISVWSAPGNGGKTTIARLAASELAADGYTVLFFQEDAGAGDLPMLHAHAEENDYKLLSSTLSGANPEDQLEVLTALVREDVDLSGHVMFFDTLKKYADLMNKRGSRSFFTLMRALTQRGATIVLLGHTNKHTGPDGKMMFEGVGDVRNDVDELIYLDAGEKDASGTMLVTLRPDKVRSTAAPASFTIDTHSVTAKAVHDVVDVKALLERAAQREKDQPLIDAIDEVLTAGGKKLQDIVVSVCKATGRGEKAVRAVIDRYSSQSAESTWALWSETRLALNNTRYFSIKPGRGGGLAA